MTVLLLDIDGVLNEPQQPVGDEIITKLAKLSFKFPIYFVTGNSFTKSVDMLGWHAFTGIFCNNGDELRDPYGFKVWEDTESPPLPEMQHFLAAHNDFNNCVEWRNPRFVNFCPIGRYATKEQREAHDPSWRESFIEKLKSRFDVEAVTGGSVSVDIYSKGADKARAAKYLNDSGVSFIFIGDKTAPGGNDYCIVQYCESNVDKSNKYFTSTGPRNTLELLEQILTNK